MSSPRFVLLFFASAVGFALGLGILGLVGCGPRELSVEGRVTPVYGALVYLRVPTGPADVFGLREGDILVGWRQGEDHGLIESPLDARRIEIERAPAGALVLRVFRQGEEIEIPVTSGRWEVELQTSEPTQTTGEGAELNGVETARWHRYEMACARALEGEVELAQQAFEATRLEYGPLEPGIEALLFELEGLAWRKARVKDQERTVLQKALAWRRAEEPGSLALAASLVRLAEVARPRDAKPLLDEAREILERGAPNSADLADVLNRLGSVALFESQLEVAQELYTASLELRRRSVPGSYRVADSYANLGLVAGDLGRLDEAERLLTQALDFYPPELLTPTAITANNLASVQRDKGSYRQARETWERSLSIFRRLDPGSVAVAGVLNNLGNLSLRTDDLDRAQERYQESLTLRRTLGPKRRDVAESLNNLGVVARRQGRYSAARAFTEESLKLKQEVAPGTSSHSNTLFSLGELALDEEKFEEAEARLREALALRLKIAPKSIAVADNLVILGRMLEAAGRYDEAVESWRQGIDLLDEMRTSFRFSAQERSIFGSRFQNQYRGLALLLVERDQPQEAFELLERSRARALRTMRAQRSESPASESPALDWPTIRRALDRGTRLVVFSVGTRETLVALGRDSTASGLGLDFHRVPIERKTLLRKVELFRALVARGRDNPEIEGALIAQGQSLFNILLGPVADQLETAKRLVIVPDLPLNTLPFAGLVLPGLVSPWDTGRFVGEWKPFSFAASGTLFAQAKGGRRQSRVEPSITVFAQTQGGLPLPGADAEARRIAELFPRRSEILLNAEAKESTLKSRLTGPVDYLHFAAHAKVNSRFPLDSALVLTPGDGEDGLLRASEVIEQLSLEVDLVTLSACDTGLGRELGGEGILGLSHAFLFSGARAILTSLWAVSDDSTAEWMSVFYDNLRRGVDRDEAVQEAQIQVMKSSEASRHPYYWAAFQLWGDWGS